MPSESKVQGTFNVEYLSKDGSFKSLAVTKNFEIPDEITTVSIKITSEDGSKQEDVEGTFKRVLIKDVAEALEWLQDPKRAYAFIGAAMYGFDLWARNAVKAPIATEIEGPGKAIAKLAKDLIASYAKMGKTITMEKALIKAQLMHEED